MLDPLITGILLGVLALVIAVGVYLVFVSSTQSEDDDLDDDPELRGRGSKNNESFEDDER